MMILVVLLALEGVGGVAQMCFRLFGEWDWGEVRGRE